MQRAESNNDGWISIPRKDDRKGRRDRARHSNDVDELCWLTEMLAVQPQEPSIESSSVSPSVLLLCGFPGSGKTAFSSALEKLQPWKYVRICQDDLKTRDACIAAARRTLINERKCAVIDRCNFDRKQRSHFIQLASALNSQQDSSVDSKTSSSTRIIENIDVTRNNPDLSNRPSIPVDCIVLDVGREVCQNRCFARKNHPTLQAGNVKRVLSMMAKSWQSPSMEIEGLRSVVYVRNEQEFQDTLLSLLGSYGKGRA